MSDGMHDFMIDKHGDLATGARDIPKIREYIDGLAKYVSTFHLTDIDGVNQRAVRTEHVEFVKAWPMHDTHAAGRKRRFVNPNYEHARRLTDIIAECDCGTAIAYGRGSEYDPLDNNDDHVDGCKVYDRLRARADVHEQRHEEMVRLSHLGWRGTDMAPRFGAGDDTMGAIAGDLNLKLRELYDEYRQKAANTYKHLVHEADEPASVVCEIYGHDKSTLGRWANGKHTYEYHKKQSADS